MFTIELKTRKVMVDLYALSVADVRELVEAATETDTKKKKTKTTDEIMSKAVGLTVDELQSLPYPEYRKLSRFFWQCINDPLRDEDEAKNSQSASTSE